MDVKQRSKAERMHRHYSNLKKDKKVKECPFCGYLVLTRVSGKGKRFFDCPQCGATITFTNADAEESLELWESRQ